MGNYKLKETEVVLFKGDIKLPNNEEISKLLLTNENLVFTTPNKNENGEYENKIEVFSAEEVKIYEDKPQIKTKGNIVEIYFLSTEKEFNFVHKLDSLKFMTAAKKLLTGKSFGKSCSNAIKVGALGVKTALTSETTKTIAKKVGVVLNEVGVMAKSAGNTVIGLASEVGKTARNVSEAALNVSVAAKNVTDAKVAVKGVVSGAIAGVAENKKSS